MGCLFEGDTEMKAVFVIDDIPNELDVNDLLIDYCVHTKGEYKTIRKGGNHPIKPLPQERDEYCIMYGKNCELISTINAESRGFNQCLKEITE